jgi:hypothetical protein
MKPQQTKARAELAAMSSDDFKARITTILGASDEIAGARRPNPLLVRDRKRPRRPQQHRARKRGVPKS